MRKLLLAALCLSVFSTYAKENTKSGLTKVFIPIQKVYVPKGFDSNDQSEVAIEGYLPNTCYRAPEAIAVDREGKTYIDVKADYSEGDYCMEMVVPYLVKAKLGVKRSGIYMLEVKGSNQVLKKNIGIDEANSRDIDENVYAAVNAVETEVGSTRVELRGMNPNSCFSFREIKTVVNDENDAIAVLPIMDVDTSSVCTHRLVPFTYEFDLPKELKDKKVLIHVRKMEGLSLNALYYPN